MPGKKSGLQGGGAMMSHCKNNHAVEKFIWQVCLGVKDRKEEETQEAITTAQTTENENLNVEGRERSK